MTSKLKRAAALLLSAALLLGLSGCASQKKTDGEKLKIKIEFDDSASIFNYIISLREVFPEYEFEFQSMVRRGHVDGIQNTQNAQIILSQEAIHNDVSDIIVSDVFNDKLPNLAGAFAEMSGNGYTSRFQTSYLNSISIEGKLYYLPFFIGLKGIIYNQTLFEENGWEVPQTYAEFTELLTTINNTGMPPIAVRTMTDFGAGLFATAYLINDGSTLAGHEWLNAFSVENPTATPEIFSNTLSYLKMLQDVGHIAQNHQLLSHKQIAHLMKERNVAMCIANGESLSQIYNSGTHDKFAMMPLYSEMFPDGIIIEHNTLYLGMSAKSMADPEKAEALYRIADYIYSREGQLRLLETCRGLVSPCYSLMNELASPSLAEFKRVLEGGNLVEEVAPFAVDSSFDDAVLTFLTSDVTQETQSVFLKELNDARAIWLSADEQHQAVITQATETFSQQQLLNLILTAMKVQTGSDVAVAPALSKPDFYGHNHDTQLARSKLYQGDVTAPILESSLVALFDVNVYAMTGEQLLALVDYNLTNNIYLGMQLELTFRKDKDAYFTTGAHLSSGERVDPNAEYRVCTPNNISVPQSGYIRKEPYEPTLIETLTAYCASQPSISPIDLPEPKYIQGGT